MKTVLVTLVMMMMMAFIWEVKGYKYKPMKNKALEMCKVRCDDDDDFH